MKSLTITWESCVRTRTVASGCRACVDACPTGALDLSGPRGSVAADLSRCIECGSCQASCPTEAFASAFDPAAFIASASAAVRCGEGVPCAGALAAEDLVALALRRGQLALTTVDSCAAAKGHAAIASRVAEANALLAAIGAAARVSVRRAVEAPVTTGPHATPRPKPAREGAPSRRAFFARFSPVQPAAGEAPSEARGPLRLALDPARLDIKAMRTTSVPRRRLRLLDAVAEEAARRARNRATGPAGTADRLPSAAIGFSSSKSLDVDACTACMLCVNTCPTGALSTSALRQELRFDAASCVKCATCHDVCEPRAITVAPAFDVGAFTARSAQPLGRLLVRSCGECGVSFKRRGDAVLCPRCLALEDEARELAGMR